MKQDEDIDRLLASYLDGTSTLDDERALREYFAADAVDPRHEGFRDMFRAIDDMIMPAQLEERLNDTIDRLGNVRVCHKFGLRKFAIRMTAIAACVAVVMIIAISSDQSPGDDDVMCGMTTEEVAAHTTMALRLMSRTINAGSGYATRALEAIPREKKDNSGIYIENSCFTSVPQ